MAVFVQNILREVLESMILKAWMPGDLAFEVVDHKSHST